MGKMGIANGPNSQDEWKTRCTAWRAGTQMVAPMASSSVSSTDLLASAGCGLKPTQVSSQQAGFSGVATALVREVADRPVKWQGTESCRQLHRCQPVHCVSRRVWPRLRTQKAKRTVSRRRL